MVMATDEAVKVLRQRQDDLLRQLHALTKRRDAHLDTLEGTMVLEQSLVSELGQIQDRLSLLGMHTYCGCVECRPSGIAPADPT